VARQKPRSCRSSTTRPSPSDGQYLLRESRLQSFISSPLTFIRSIFSRSPRIIVACPSKSNGGSLNSKSGLHEFQHLDSWFHPRAFSPEVCISTSRLLVSSGAFSPRVKNQASRVLLRSTVVVHFGASTFISGRHITPGPYLCQLYMQTPLELRSPKYMAAVSADMWHPYQS
jgi:hypothetical protein